MISLALAVSASAWLAVPGQFLAESDSFGAADVIVVLSGGAATRAPLAAELYRRGLAPVVITLGDRENPLPRALKEQVTEAQLNAMILERHGVPRAAIVVIPRGERTWEEAQIIRDYVSARPVRALIVVTSNFHARRARWAFHRALPSAGPRVMVVSAESPQGPYRDWWRSREGVLAVSSETAKLGYYLIRYGVSTKAA